MTNAEAIALSAAHEVGVYARQPVAFVRGRGAELWDADGKRYLDFFAGLAVNNLGHCHPAVVDAVKTQAESLLHASNVYYTAPAAELAALLCRHSFAERVFLCNSGAEANEAAMKLARRWGSEHGGRYEILATTGSFHGRTFATLTATGQEKYHQGFQPLLPGVRLVPYDDAAATAAALLRAPAPRELHRRLVRLGAAVREEDALGERVPAEERAQLAGGERVVDVGGVEQPRRLRRDRFHHRRMAVAQVVHREAREEIQVALAVRVPQLRAAPAHEGDRLARVHAHLVRGAQRDHLGVGQSAPLTHALAARPRLRRAVRGRISVPTPREVSTSSSTACRTRPSITWACLTPPRIASRQHSTLGIIPPAIVPSRIMSPAASAGSVSMSAPSRLFTPSTSVSRMSFSARSASATLPATTSALML